MMQNRWINAVMAHQRIVGDERRVLCNNLVDNVRHCWEHTKEESGFDIMHKEYRHRYAFEMILAAATQTQEFELENMREDGFYLVRRFPPRVPAFYLSLKEENQLKLKLEECLAHPGRRGLPMFGAMTSGNRWIFAQMLNNQQILTLDELLIENASDTEGIRKVFETMFSIIEYQEIGFLKAFKWPV
jgi:hypothetical protein